jgi:hypothetical protein
VHVNIFSFGHRCMYKSCSDIALCRDQSFFGCQYHDCSNCRPVYYWCPSLKIINSMYLAIPSDTEASFELLWKKIRKSLELERPSLWKYIHFRCSFYQSPNVHLVFQGLELSLTGLPILCRKWPIHSHFPRWIVIVVL